LPLHSDGIARTVEWAQRAEQAVRGGGGGGGSGESVGGGESVRVVLTTEALLGARNRATQLRQELLKRCSARWSRCT
jgi:hypothetical protein